MIWRSPVVRWMRQGHIPRSVFVFLPLGGSLVAGQRGTKVSEYPTIVRTFCF